MTTQKDPSPEALANVTDHNVRARAHLLPEEQAVEGSPGPAKRDLDPRLQAEAILAESEERTVHPDAHDAQGGQRTSEETADDL
jgi:hypothetical protein